MKVTRYLGLIGAVLAVAALTSNARATTWEYNWNGLSTGKVDANPAANGKGGLFQATLKKDNVQVAFGSYCNELGQTISTGAVTPIDVVTLTSKTQAQWVAAVAVDHTLGTYDGVGVLHTVDNAKRGALAWVMAQHFNDAPGLHGTTGTSGGNGTGGSENIGQQALQLAIWNLWGFTGIDAYSNLSGTGAGTLARSWVTDAVNNHSGYTDNRVLWVRLKQGGSFQDQIMWNPNVPPQDVTPEASSLALLLPGLIPIGIAMRRRARRS